MSKRKKAYVTVIIPCYLSLATLDRAIKSISLQSVLPNEVIIIDDCSPEHTQTSKNIRRISKKYKSLFDVKIVLLKKNRGAGNARNIGWNNATQPYIALLDSDDAWHPKKIEIQYNFMEKNPNVDICGHDYRIILDGLIPCWNLPSFNFKYIKKYNILFSNPFCTPSVMLRRKIPFRFNSTKRYVDDHLLWLQIAFGNLCITKIGQPLVAVYKPMYGYSGLSSDLFAMEKSELENFWILFYEKKIGFSLAFFSSLYSFSKFLFRCLVVFFRKILRSFY
jgi:glycosyltransferase involved in cell wall biosynthesis